MFHVGLCYIVFVIACWERADLLALLYVMFSRVFVTFPYGIPDHVLYLIVPIPDLCLSLYFYCGHLHKIFRII